MEFFFGLLAGLASVGVPLLIYFLGKKVKRPTRLDKIYTLSDADVKRINELRDENKANK